MRTLKQLTEGLFDVEGSVDDKDRADDVISQLSTLCDEEGAFSVDKDSVKIDFPKPWESVYIKDGLKKLSELGIKKIITADELHIWGGWLRDMMVDAVSIQKDGGMLTDWSINIDVKDSTGTVLKNLKLLGSTDIDAINSRISLSGCEIDTTESNYPQIRINRARDVKLVSTSIKSKLLSFHRIPTSSKLANEVRRFVAEWESNWDDFETIEHLYSSDRYSINQIIKLPKLEVDAIDFIDEDMPERSSLHFMNDKAIKRLPKHYQEMSVKMKDGWYVYYGDILEECLIKRK